MYKQMTLKVSELQPYPIRELREGVLEQLRERIKERGYNVAKSLIVVKQDGDFLVADGNHRLQILIEQGIEEVPCVVYENEDIYKLAIEANQDEDVYASMDLFDWLDIIRKLKEDGYQYQEIGNKIGWNEGQIKKYSMLLSKVPTVLNLCKQHQIGRGTKKVPRGTFDFTEYWFRTSGLYNLCETYQLKLINAFIADKFNWNKSKVQSEASKYKQWQEFIEIAEEKLGNEDDIDTIIELIENNTFKTREQLITKIDDFNSKAQNKIIYGDALIELEKLEDASIDIVITDPPYGIDYKSNMSKYNEHVTKEGIENDGLNDALELLDNSCELLQQKTKANAHIYIFTSWKVYPEFKSIVEKYFTVKSLIIWNKGNASMGDLEGSWGNQYEMIIFATKGNRKLNIRKFDILNIPRIHSTKAIHPTQKPEALIKELLEASVQPADTICDPFIGSGSTIKAVKEYDKSLNYIGIELDKERFEKAKAYILGGE